MAFFRQWRFTAIALCLLPTIAFAEPKDDARRHFIEGLEAAKDKKYQEALDHFLAAQAVYPHPSTLYNIGRAYQDLDNLEQALAYYRLYQAADPSKADEISPIIAVLEARLRVDQPIAPLPSESAPVSNDVLGRLRQLADEMQLKVDEVNALANSLTVMPADSTTPISAPVDSITELPQGELLTDAYQRIIVTASRYGQEPLDSPSAVTVLTSEDIRLSGATTIPDLLRRVVGVEAMQLASGHTELSIRGFNRELSNKVLFLVDGRSTYLDFLGTTFWGTVPISLEEIERIEVIRGPGSAVYGANAVTGVVNIITKTPGEGENQVHLDVGSPAYGRGSATLSGTAGLTTYRLGAGYEQTGRWAKEVDPANPTRRFLIENQDLGAKIFHANGRFDRTFAAGKGFASLSAGYSDGYQEFYNIGALGDYAIDLRSHYLRADGGWGPWHLRIFWNSSLGKTGAWSEPTEWTRSLTADVDVDVVDIEFEGTHAFTTGPINHRLNAGIGYRYKSTDFGYIPDRIQEHHQNAFLNEEAAIGPVKLVASLRADHHPLLPISQTLSPRGAVIWRFLPRSSLRLSGGTAFRAPNHTESYMNFTLPTSNDAVFILDYGDITLKPERIVTGELGWHDESSPYHRADIAVYVNHLQNIIDLRDVSSALDSNPPDTAYNEEIGGYLAGSTGWTNTSRRYTGVGGEAEAEFFPLDGLDIYANFAVARIFQSEPEKETTVDYSTSTFKMNVGATWRSPYRTDFSLHSSFVSGQTWGLRAFDSNGQLQENPQEVPARMIVTARIGVRPFKDDSLELAVSGWNLGALASGDAGIFGKNREHPKGQPVGPKVYGSASYRF